VRWLCRDPAGWRWVPGRRWEQEAEENQDGGCRGKTHRRLEVVGGGPGGRSVAGEEVTERPQVCSPAGWEVVPT
jgi:hypothetical protein